MLHRPTRGRYFVHELAEVLVIANGLRARRTTPLPEIDLSGRGRAPDEVVPSSDRLSLAARSARHLDSSRKPCRTCRAIQFSDGALDESPVDHTSGGECKAQVLPATTHRSQPRARIRSRHASVPASSAIDSAPINGWSGAKTLSAPETPRTATMILLQMGQPIAR